VLIYIEKIFFFLSKRCQRLLNKFKVDTQKIITEDSEREKDPLLLVIKWNETNLLLARNTQKATILKRMFLK